jgi:DNA polymerase III alpha subunit
VGKKYGEKQVARILLINVLRGTMKLEDIARLMTYINGDVDDQSDDILHDKQLYNLMCSLLFRILRKRQLRADEIAREIEYGLSEEYQGESRVRLKKVLSIMLYGCIASYYRQQAELEFFEIEED